jgi:FKBP-type peptidyl-prolyl cis-trans isomerase FkpA
VAVKGNGQRIFILVIVVVFFLSSLGVSGLVVWDQLRNKDDATADQATSDIQKQIDELQKQQGQSNTEGVKVESTDIVAGTGAEATSGKKVTVNYVGTLKDGTKFDSSYDRNQPFDFQLGGGQVIKGWDQGVVGMKVGGKRKLVIPAVLAYGNQSPSPTIPPNSDLVFEIELLNVQ